MPISVKTSCPQTRTTSLVGGRVAYNRFSLPWHPSAASAAQLRYSYFYQPMKVLTSTENYRSRLFVYCVLFSD